MGQQGNDILYGEDGDDLLIGGSNVAGSLDDDDVIDGGAGNDAIAGDNAECCFRYDLLDPRMRAHRRHGDLRHEHPGRQRRRRARHRTRRDDQNDPTATGLTCNALAGFVGCRQYRVNLLDHSDAIEAGRPELWGDDYIAGGAGEDEIWGQLGDDVIQGDG